MPARRLKKTPAHLEITAFINLIVVLVPFLLSVSVFTHLAVIDLSLPAQSNDQVQKLDPNKPLKLEVIVRANRIEVNDKHGGALPGSPFPNRSWLRSPDRSRQTIARRNAGCSPVRPRRRSRT